MSKFSEYLKLIPKAIKTPNVILSGWLKDIQLEYGKLPEDEVKEIIRRRVICTECPLNSINALKSKEYKELYGEGYTTDREDLHCSACGCPIKKKTASLDSECGLKSYNDEHPDNIQELKWTKYGT